MGTGITDLYTADDLATEICEAFGASDQVTRNKAYRCLNRALRIVVRKGRWPFFRVEDELVTTTTNVERYKLRSAIKLPEFLHLRDPAVKIKMIGLRELRKMYPNNVQLTGVPLFWRICDYNEQSQSYQIGLWPIPDGTYSIYMDADKNPIFLQDRDDDIRSTGLPEEMIETVIDIAIALMYEKNNVALYNQKLSMAMAQLDEDYYRLGNHLDDDMNAREYSGLDYLKKFDPILPPGYS